MRRMYDENEIKLIASEAGGGGGKLYMHDIALTMKTSNDGIFKCKVLSTRSTAYERTDLNINFADIVLEKSFHNGVVPTYYEVKTFYQSVPNSDSITIDYFSSYPFSVTQHETKQFTVENSDFNDTVTEL